MKEKESIIYCGELEEEEEKEGKENKRIGNMSATAAALERKTSL